MQARARAPLRVFPPIVVYLKTAFQSHKVDILLVILLKID